jgi:hypothetical protein
MPLQCVQQLGPNVGIETKSAPANLQESSARDWLHCIVVNDTGSFFVHHLAKVGASNRKASGVWSIQI